MERHRQRLSPDPFVIPGEVAAAPVVPLRGEDFVACVGSFRASTEGLFVHVEVLAVGAAQLGDMAGLGAPGRPGLSLWAEGGGQVVLSNIMSGHEGYPDNSQSVVRATFELWLPWDLSQPDALEPDIVLAWPERTKDVRRVHLTAAQLREAAQGSPRLPTDGP
ncbi:MAG TPA: hypothetical protein VGK17_24250 [Propionicimonas sp.]|jgi:hypothetical protein